MNFRSSAVRIAAVILSLSLLLLAAGCGSSYGDPEPAARAASALA